MKIGIVGTGPAALMAGSQLLLRGAEVTFFDHKKAAGRKFLVAGHGGFNLSHAESQELFLSRYNCEEIRRYVREFSNRQLVAWLHTIGIETYEGSTGKIFPVKGTKPIEVLKAWLDWLSGKGAVFCYEHRMVDFSEDMLCMEYQGSEVKFSFDRLVLALGGGSWKKTGSDGSWVKLFRSKGIAVEDLVAGNAGMNYDFREQASGMEGSVIKNVVISHGKTSRSGELTITNYGFEGGPVYYLNAAYRENPHIPLYVDLKPQWPQEKVLQIIANASNTAEALKKMKLPKAAVWLLKTELSKAEYTSAKVLSEKIKSLPLKVNSLRPIDEAISTSGGVSWNAVNADLSLKSFEKIAVCGEMLDWDAPTGGYLLQACFATGYYAGKQMPLD